MDLLIVDVEPMRGVVVAKQSGREAAEVIVDIVLTRRSRATGYRLISLLIALELKRSPGAILKLILPVLLYYRMIDDLLKP
jgi:hypothetical protein